MRINLLKGRSLLVEGSVKIEITAGEVSVLGKGLSEGNTLTIAKSRPFVIEAEADSGIEAQLGKGAKVELLERSAIPMDWKLAVEEIMESPKPCVILILGGVNVGKSTLATYIANISYDSCKTAVVDADVGQSDIGPPCTIGMGILNEKLTTLSDVPLEAVYFVGKTSPYGYVHRCVEGTKRMVDLAKEKGVEIVIVDSTGWISSDARELKLAKAKAIRPKFILALQRGDELEYLLEPLSEMSVVRSLTVSEYVQARSRSQRRSLRERAYDRYFAGGKKVVLNLTQLKMIDSIGKGKRGQLVGFLDSRKEFLGLGIIEKMDYAKGKAVIFTPVGEGVDGIMFGALRLVYKDGGFREVI